MKHMVELGSSADYNDTDSIQTKAVKRVAEDDVAMLEGKAAKRRALGNITNRNPKHPQQQKEENNHQLFIGSVKAASNASHKVSARPAPKRALPTGVEYDVDLDNWKDINQVPEYAFEVFNYLKSRERRFQVEDYIESQPNLSLSMRSVLVDWMVSVQWGFQLYPETLFKAVKLTDLYLMKVLLVSKNSLQLVGVASLLIAAKYSEYDPPSANDFLYTCCDAYTQGELFRMEVEILKAVGFEIGVPDSYSFLRRFIECAKISGKISMLARYILEFSLMNYVTVSFSESKKAAAALFIAMQNSVPEEGWSTTMEYYTGYKALDLKQVVMVLNDGMRKPFNKCTNIKKYFERKEYLKVAEMELKKTYELKL